MSKLRSAVELALITIALFLTAYGTARPQNFYPGVPVVPMGYCSLSAAQLATAVGLSACTSGTFTGTGAGTTLTASAVTGAINVGQTISGTGVPTGTTIVSQVNGPKAGAGTYTTSVPTTASAASITVGGIPQAANSALLEADTATVRFRDDGAAPTAALGIFLVGTAGNTVQNQVFYTGTLSQILFIAATGSPILHVAFYQFFRQ